MRIGILASGEGRFIDVALAVIKRIHPEVLFFGFSDRSCGAYRILEQHCCKAYLFCSEDKDLISNRAANFFRHNHCELVILSYSRLVTAALHDTQVCFNIHPSLLPDYKGIGAVKRAFVEQSPNLGVTIHKVDSTVDGGDTICQVMTRPSLHSLEYWQSLSYLMKTLLLSSFLNELIDHSGEKTISSISLSPHLSENLVLLGIKTSSQIVTAIIDAVLESNAASMVIREG